ncbi:putative Ig domain-containing protein [Acinetobacter guillouiae]|uniref:putative Ig domain-containing protein n=1 Tax=Acinetobacter guillouiae TaxID=106649 RepID=UPI003AF7434F
MINIYELWSRYLFNSNQSPIGDALLDNKYIRDTKELGDVVTIKASEFNASYGQFIKGSDFGAIQKFFVDQIDPNENFNYQNLLQNAQENPSVFTVDSQGVISFNLKTLFNMALGKKVYDLDILATEGQKVLSQANFHIEGETAVEYAERVQMFQTTGFVIGNSKVSPDGQNMVFDETVKFYVYPDNTRYIENFSIQPTPNADNFDFEGGIRPIFQDGQYKQYFKDLASWLVELSGNKINSIVTDPSNIGRNVPIHYIDDVKGSIYNLSTFNADKNREKNYIESHMDASKLAIGAIEIFASFNERNITSFRDSEGRLVLYGTNDIDDIDLTIDDTVEKYKQALNGLLSVAGLGTATIATLTHIISSLNNDKGVSYVAGGGADNISGTMLNDKLLGGDGDDTLFGGFGNDKLIGGNDNDILRDASGDDILEGGSGNDILIGGHDSDQLYGGDDNDFLYGDFDNDMISFVNSGGNDYLEGGDGVDHLYGGKGNDILYGGAHLDYLYGGDDDDILIVSNFIKNGTSTENALLMDENKNYAWGGAGSDQLFGGNGDDELYAGDEENDLDDIGTENTIYGVGGNDNIYGGVGNDHLYGGKGLDIIKAGDGKDYLYGEDGDDNLNGGAGSDGLYGGQNDDKLYGGSGNDILVGGDGNDDLYGGKSSSIIYEKIVFKLVPTASYTINSYENNAKPQSPKPLINPSELPESNNDSIESVISGLAKNLDQLEIDISFGGGGLDKYHWESGDGTQTIWEEFKTGSSAELYVNQVKIKDFYLTSDFRYVNADDLELVSLLSKTWVVRTTESGHKQVLFNLIQFDLKNNNYGLKVHDNFAEQAQSAITPPPPRDPFALDLDGDGIETTGLNQRVLFDHNGDGVKTATGWLKPDDGWLTLDRNMNGQIDNGSELFGVDTILQNGKKATDGFAALADLDENQDGLISSLDNLFSQFNVWRDLNQDGISQSNELFSLSSLGITEINLQNPRILNAQQNGNELTMVGSYKKQNGQDGIIGQSFNLNLAVNPMISEFTDKIPLISEALLLPDLNGRGQVRNFREAVSLSQNLKQLSMDYISGVAIDVEAILIAWANTSLFESGIEQVNKLKNLGYNIDINYHFSGIYNDIQYEQILKKINVLEKFIGSKFSQNEFESLINQALSGSESRANISFNTVQVNSINAAYETLINELKNGLREYSPQVQTLMKSILFYQEKLIIDDFDFSFLKGDLSGGYDFSNFINVIVDMLNNNANSALFALKDVVDVIGKNKLLIMGFESQNLYNSILNFSVEIQHRVKSIFEYKNLTDEADNYKLIGPLLGLNALGGDDKIDASTIESVVVFAGSGNDEITLLSNSFVYGDNGNDVVHILGSNNSVYGQEDDDLIQIYHANNLVYGGSGNDKLIVNNLSYVDIFDGGYSGEIFESLNTLKIFDIENLDIFGGENNNIHIENASNQQNIFLKNVKDTIVYSGSGNDNLISENGDNVKLVGGLGDDYFRADNGAILDGGIGYDTYSAMGNHAVKILDSDFRGKIIINADQVYFKWSGDENNITKWLIKNPDEKDAKIVSYTEYSTNSSLTQYQYTKSSNRIADIEYNSTTGELSLVKDNTIYFKIQNIFSFNDLEQIKNKMDILISGTVSYRAATAFHYKEYLDTQLTFSDFLEQGRVTAKYSQMDDTIYGLTQLGLDTIYAGPGSDHIYTGLGKSFVYAEDGKDYIVATDTNAVDEIYGGAGDDTIYNYDIRDESLTIKYNFYNRDKIYGGEGNDTIYVNYQYTEVYGGEGNDILISGEGGSYLDGGEGADHLIGGSGDDTFIVDEFDTYEENNPNGGYDTLYIAQSIDLGSGYFEAVTLQGDQNFNIHGNAANNRLIGNVGNNYIDGRTGSDYMAGGAGDDYYVIDITDSIGIDEDGNSVILDGDQVVEDFNAGIDTVERWQDSRFISQDGDGNPILTNNHRLLDDNIENLILKGNAKTAFGNDLDNIIVGNSQDNYIDGLSGNDTYVFARGGGTDTYSFEDSIDSVNILKIQGYAFNDVSAQKYGNSVYLSFKGTNDHIWLSNYYVADTQDMTYRMDQIIFDSGTTWTSNDIDILINRAQSNHAPTVNAVIPLITSNQGALFSYKFASNIIIDQDSWDALSYKITLTTKGSNGQYLPIPSWLNFDAETQTLSGTPPSNVTGNLSFFYWGTDMYGLGTATSFNLKVNLPNQAPIVLNAIADQSVTEAKAFNYTVPSTAFKDPDGDALTYTATLEDGSPLPIWLTFNASTRVLSGTSPDNTAPLNIKITVKDTANQSVSDVFKLTFAVQNLTINGTSSADTLYGASGNDSITGQAGNDILYGQSGNDTLNGGTGNDTMYGGKGDDIYVVDSTTDIVSENENEGIDIVQSSVTYILGSDVENLTLTGTTAINGTGNVLNNIILGNSAINTLTGGVGDDYLDGGAGADKLLGGVGNDTYVIDNTSDMITENANEGTDTVRSSVTLTLGNNLENLTLTGTTAINGTGNAFNNTIIGNSAVNTLTGGAGDDYLDGGAGADKLLGGVGNDTYVIDNTSDTITENANEGTDTILSSITLTLGSNLENLILTGSTAINATGNTLNNMLTGNSGANVLNGGTGNDILDGQGGNDQFTGGIGSDTIVYQLLVVSDAVGGNGNDSWSDFTVGNTTKNVNADKIDISDLLVDYTGNYNFSSLDPFIKTIVSGSNTQFYIDRDGGGSTYSSSLLLTLNNVNTNLNDLINNQQIMI